MFFVSYEVGCCDKNYGHSSTEVVLYSTRRQHLAHVYIYIYEIYYFIQLQAWIAE